MTKLIIVSPNFANVHKSGCLKSSSGNKHSLHVLINVKDQSAAGAKSNVNNKMSLLEFSRQALNETTNLSISIKEQQVFNPKAVLTH
jgi:hypothetical protein